MKYIITENRIFNLITTYLESIFGEIIPTNLEKGDEDYVQFKTPNGKLLMDGFINDHLLVTPHVWNAIRELFNLDDDDVSEIIEKWTESKYGLTWNSNVIMDVSEDMN